MTERVDPPLQAGEAETLLGYLDYHRATLRRKVAGLDAEALARTLSPSSMTLGGLVSHLTLVEDHWFSVVLAGNKPAPPWDGVDWDADNDWDWHMAAGLTLDELLTPYDETVARVDALIATALEAAGPGALSVKTSRRQGVPFSLRWILLHMIEEYARHNGHADLLRESIDGEVGE
ncbi:MAG: DinB family protein [Nocardioidaceae bacterium]|nr:DinB family protein [Nocardioidaceae bacterium]